MKWKFSRAFLLLTLCFALLTGCGGDTDNHEDSVLAKDNAVVEVAQLGDSTDAEGTETDAAPEESTQEDDKELATEAPDEPVEPVEEERPVQEVLATSLPNEEKKASFTLSAVPAYSGKAYIAVNGNEPYFTNADYRTDSFETYASLDSLGRCGVAYANVGQDLMPTEERGSIGQVKPTGWHTVKYDCVDGKYLYNRCHLIGFQLTAENANTSNLITGTRYLNIEGMLPFENMVADYVKETNNHVLYRVTPVFEGSNLVATGVLMEGYSVEDQGDGVTFCVFAYNAQPGVNIEYATGGSSLVGSAAESKPETPPVKPQPPKEETPKPVEPLKQEVPVDPAPSGQHDYVLNTNTKKFHIPSCSSADDIKESNRKEFTGDRQELINQGYAACKRCDP